MIDTNSAASDFNERALSARWTAVPEDTLGGWCVTSNGKTPANGGVMVADMMTREVAEHIADLHNRFLGSGVDLDVYADNLRLTAELEATRSNRDEIAATLNAVREALGLSGDDHPVDAIRRLRVAHQWSVRNRSGVVETPSRTEEAARRWADTTGGEVVYRPVGEWTTAEVQP